jgi:hypothetical protein
MIPSQSASLGNESTGAAAVVVENREQATTHPAAAYANRPAIFVLSALPRMTVAYYADDALLGQPSKTSPQLELR